MIVLAQNLALSFSYRFVKLLYPSECYLSGRLLMTSSCQSNLLSKVLPETHDTETTGIRLGLYQVEVVKELGHLRYTCPRLRPLTVPVVMGVSNTHRVTSSQFEFVCLHNETYLLHF